MMFSKSSYLFVFAAACDAARQNFASLGASNRGAALSVEEVGQQATASLTVKGWEIKGPVHKDLVKLNGTLANWTVQIMNATSLALKADQKIEKFVNSSQGALSKLESALKTSQKVVKTLQKALTAAEAKETTDEVVVETDDGKELSANAAEDTAEGQLTAAETAEGVAAAEEATADTAAGVADTAATATDATAGVLDAIAAAQLGLDPVCDAAAVAADAVAAADTTAAGVVDAAAIAATSEEAIDVAVDATDSAREVSAEAAADAARERDAEAHETEEEQAEYVERAKQRLAKADKALNKLQKGVEEAQKVLDKAQEVAKQNQKVVLALRNMSNSTKMGQTALDAILKALRNMSNSTKMGQAALDAILKAYEPTPAPTPLPPPQTWTLVARQTMPVLFSPLEWSKNADDPANDNYAILDRLEEFRVDWAFEFKLVWPGKDEQHWRQTSNPVTSTDGGVEGYAAIEAPYSQNAWGGLEYCSGDQALLDGSIGSQWWFAVGTTWTLGGGIPGPDAWVQKVELYVYGPAALQ